MNIGIVGYGRMGHEIETQAILRNHTILYTIAPHNRQASFSSLSEVPQHVLDKTDVIIEFSLPHVVVENASIYSKASIPSILGTTGWEKHRPDLIKILESTHNICVYGANFSIGAHVFSRIAEHAAEIMDKFSHYDVGLSEIHHVKKLDRPSGTALMTARRVLSRLKRKTHLVVDIPSDDVLDPHALSVASQRIGSECGTHEVIFDSSCDTITVSHKARNKTGFALGAVLSAEWVFQNKNKCEENLILIDKVVDHIISSI